MVLAISGDLAELKPFSTQIIAEVKDNVQRKINQVEFRLDHMEDELKRLYRIVGAMRDMRATDISIIPVGSYVSGQRVIVSPYDGLVYIQEQFKW